MLLLLGNMSFLILTSMILCCCCTMMIHHLPKHVSSVEFVDKEKPTTVLVMSVCWGFGEWKGVRFHFASAGETFFPLQKQSDRSDRCRSAGNISLCCTHCVVYRKDVSCCP